MAKIILEGVAHSYDRGKTLALSPLNMVFEQGGAYALLGPSGCGKTTLLKILSGLLRPTEGKVFFDGKEVTNLSPRERNIGQVFQFPVIYETMTVQENLSFPLVNRKESMTPAQIKARVEEVALLLEIDPFLKTSGSALSPHLKQLVSLGRGLVRQDMAAILLDEPLTVVDPEKKSLLRRKLKEVHRQMNVTLIYVTHDQMEALTFADEVLVMRDGRILQKGTPEDLFERPAHPFVGHFIGRPGMNFLPLKQGQAQGQGLMGIRPRYVEILSQKEVPRTENGDTYLSAIITGQEHLGSFIHWQLSTDSTDSSHSLKATTIAETHLKTGDRVTLRLPKDKINFYHEDLLL